MSWVRSLEESLKRFDSDLYVRISTKGIPQVWWRKTRLVKDIEEDDGPDPTHADARFVCAMTDNWKADGTPVDRGIEQVLEYLRKIDRNRFASDWLERARKLRDMDAADKKRQAHNEFMANAAELKPLYRKLDDELGIRTGHISKKLEASNGQELKKAKEKLKELRG